jgi:hypothetical protein
MEDMSREFRRKAELDHQNEFIVCDKKGIEVMRSFYSPDCAKKLKKMYPEIDFNGGSITKCLNKEYKQHHGFTFTYVIEK